MCGWPGHNALAPIIQYRMVVVVNGGTEAASMELDILLRARLRRLLDDMTNDGVKTLPTSVANNGIGIFCPLSNPSDINL